MYVKPATVKNMDEKTRLTEESVSSDECYPKTKFEKRLVVILIIVIALSIGLIITVSAYYRSESYRLNNSIPNTCVDAECITAASRLLKSIDFEQNPCEDFYSFVCGNWIKNSFLIGESVISQFTRLDTIIFLRIKEFLDIQKPELADHEKKIRNFYNACIHRDDVDMEGTLTILHDLGRFGGWPMIHIFDPYTFDWVDLVGQLFENGYPYNYLLSIGVDIDLKNVSTTLLIVSPPSLGLNDKSYYLDADDPVLNNYKDLILNLAMYFNPYININITKYHVSYSLTVERFLATTMLPKDRTTTVEEIYNIMTLVEIEEFAPKVPWRKLLKKLLPPEEIITNSTRLMVTQPAFVKTLNFLLETVDNPGGQIMLANYMMYRTALFGAEHLGTDLFNLVEDKMHHKCHRDLWQVCISSVVDLFHMSLTSTYAENYMDPQTRTLLEKLFKDIQLSLLNEITAATWLDEETRKKALLKVTKARSAIAYRDEILDDKKLNNYYKQVEVGSSHFFNMKSARIYYSKESMEGLNKEHIRFKWTETTNVLRANAFYLPHQNSIIIPIGLLQDTFFSKGRPNYLNYGSLGAILGHEYTHAFDSIGSLYDEVGNYRMWWTNQSWRNFRERTQCFIDQYDKYYDPSVDAHLNGTLTLSENIADNGGLLAAYNAYSRLLGQIGREERLPGLPFTEKQMFWISYASSWCKKQSQSILRLMMETGGHSPAKFRVTGALSNLQEFSKDFNCEKGSNLNPAKRCHLWE